LHKDLYLYIKIYNIEAKEYFTIRKIVSRINNMFISIIKQINLNVIKSN